MTISAGLDTDKLQRTLKLAMRELRRCTEELPTASEMRRARDYLTGQLELSLEGTENQMNWVGEQLLAYGKIILPGETRKCIDGVKPGQVRAVAREFFRPERMNLAVVSPLKRADGLVRILGE